MIKSFFSILVIFSFLLKAKEDLPKLEIKKLNDNVYLFTTYRYLGDYNFPSNGLFIITKEGAILIDTPWDTTQFNILIDTIKKEYHSDVKFIISTHFHDDRTAGLDYYNKMGIATFSSLNTYKLCIERNEKKAKYQFKNDTTFSIGGITLKSYFLGAGHSEDNILIWLPQYKILYGGCLIKDIESNTLGNIADANLIEWESTMLKVRNKFKSVKLVIPGHYDIGGKELIQHTYKLVKKQLSKNKH